MPSPQNEPNYSGNGSPTCLFGALETKTIPGYFQATGYVYDAVKKAFPKPPAMIGPECTGMDHYIPEFPFGGGGRFAAIGNHLYGSGQIGRPKFDPYSFSGALKNAKALADGKGMQKLWMTEFSKLSAFEYQDPLKMAILIHNTLTLADVSVYLHWDGAWGLPDVGPQVEGTLILVENPFKDRSKWTYPKGYKVLQSFYWFKHFTRFIRPTYRRVQCDIAGVSNVLASAWISLKDEYSVILINTGTVAANVTLNGFPPLGANQVTDRLYSTLDVPFTNAGLFHGNFISIPPLSITSLSTHSM
jgi:glucuronoarabinoxylan endo-1,4-beta-xylanase